MKNCAFYIVQYVPDLVRGEVLNIGILLHSPEEQYLGCLFTDDFRRVKQVHRQADLEFLRELQRDFEQQIDLHASNLPAYLREIETAYSNLIQLAPAHRCQLDDPQGDLAALFDRYVGRRESSPPPLDSRLQIKQRLTAALVRAGVWERLEKRIPAAPWTHPGDTFAFDFGYRPAMIAGVPNGHITFIHALSLKADVELAKILAYSLERVRRKEPAELTAIVEQAPAAAESALLTERILMDSGISIQPLARVEEFARSVRRQLLM